jgi:hypothetical protein
VNVLNQVLLLLHEAAAALGRSVGGVVCVQLAPSSGGHAIVRAHRRDAVRRLVAP